MKAIQKSCTVIFCLLLATVTYGQKLKPGFDKAEYIETLKINNKVHIDVAKWKDVGAVEDPQHSKLIYRSAVSGFDNLWDLWKRNDGVGIVAVRGSVQTGASFLANLYAAMVPAKGALQLDKTRSFSYNLSNNPSAAVHVGWLVSLAYLSTDIVAKIDSCHKTGMKEFVLTGHSQGGGIVFMLNSYLENLKAEGKLPADIRFKTYCSAGPKPGNLYYAYDYERMTSGGWAYNVVNSADWVPDVPFTVQTVDDFTAVNPFHGAKTQIKKMKFPKNLALKHVYNQMSKPSNKARKNYQKYLGKMISRTVRKQLPDFTIPTYYNSSYYVRTGNTVVLYADEEYFKLFSNEADNPNIWQHHLPKPYLFLAEKLK
ncbi:lipase family protein [Dyadobacter psychrotolerans]|uniref:Lipase family protein n=1 Tax=Dyadobacter psychrotolerans TaxID=2541721 RepID=A0A4R5DZ00_9BACT|nr:lipase family protein [Dyadobacter psychrotolerans]TDE17391.1 lipase family protein [Dyadobacter psychrotolerans]